MYKTFKLFFLYFIFYAIIGWLYEVFLEVFVYKWGFDNRGVLFGTYCPIYGVGALIFVFTIYRLIKKKSIKTKLLMIPVIFLCCALIATGIELIATYILEAIIGHWPWQTYARDYTYHFEGRIALSPSIRFGLGGVLFLYLLQPAFENLCAKMNVTIFNILFYFFFTVFVIDLICTLFIF